MNRVLNINLDELRAEHEAALGSLNADKKREEWLEKKRGKFSASSAYKLMTYEDKIDTFPKGAVTYVDEKIIESLTELEVNGYTNPSMQRGNNLEVEAMEAFMKKSGIVVSKYGEDQDFIQLGEHFGCTPDGLIDEDGGAETKCPDSKTHYKYLKIETQEQFKKACANYYWQIQSSMYATNRKYWYFISYDNRFLNPEKHLFFLKIERNEADIEKFKNRLRGATKRKLEGLKELKAA